MFYVRVAENIKGTTEASLSRDDPPVLPIGFGRARNLAAKENHWEIPCRAVIMGLGVVGMGVVCNFFFSPVHLKVRRNRIREPCVGW